MKEKEIFELFTIQNHIKLNKEALTLLSSYNYDLLDILKEYKKLSKSSLVDINILTRILENKYSFQSFDYEYYSLLSHYNFLRSKLKSVTNISDLVPHHGSTIQGIVYKNKDGDLVIEDSTGIIKIKGVKYRDIFITVYGNLVEDIFVVKDKEYNTFNTREYNTINTREDNTFNTREYNTINTREDNTINTREYNTINTREYNTINIKEYNTINTKEYNTINTKEYNTLNIKEGVPVDFKNHRKILIYNTVCPKVLQNDTINILLNCPLYKDTKNSYVINDTIPRIFNLNNKKISLYNKQVLNDFKDIPVYLNTYNYNFMKDHNLFYRDEYDIFILAGRTDHIEIYKEKIFVMIGQGKLALEISNDRLKFVEINIHI